MLYIDYLFPDLYVKYVNIYSVHNSFFLFHFLNTNSWLAAAVVG